MPSLRGHLFEDVGEGVALSAEAVKFVFRPSDINRSILAWQPPAKRLFERQAPIRRNVQKDMHVLVTIARIALANPQTEIAAACPSTPNSNPIQERLHPPTNIVRVIPETLGVNTHE